MGAVKPGPGDIAQHAGKTTATPEVRRRRLRLDWRTRTALRFAASLCLDGGRKRNGTD